MATTSADDAPEPDHTRNLALLVARLVRQLRKLDAHNKVANQADGYLIRHRLLSPLRDDR